MATPTIGGSGVIALHMRWGCANGWGQRGKAGRAVASKQEHTEQPRSLAGSFHPPRLDRLHQPLHRARQQQRQWRCLAQRLVIAQLSGMLAWTRVQVLHPPNSIEVRALVDTTLT